VGSEYVAPDGGLWYELAKPNGKLVNGDVWVKLYCRPPVDPNKDANV